MPKSLVLTEATAVFGTFKLLVNHPVFLAEELADLKEKRALSEARLARLVAETRDPLLKEDKQAVDLISRAVVREAVELERLTILESAGGMSVEQMMHQLAGMTASLEPLTDLSPSVGMQIDTVAHQAQQMAMELEDLEGAGMAKEFRAKLNEFKSVFTNIASMVKGLVAVADDLHSGKLAEILRPVLMWVQKRKKKTTSLLDTLQQYDAEVNKSGGDIPMKQGYLSKLFTSKAPKAASTNTAQQFQHAFEQLVSSKAPGFAQSAKAFGADIMEAPIQLLFKSFSQFDHAVARNVDLDFLGSMSKQSFGSALKNFAGNFFGGGHIGVGMK